MIRAAISLAALAAASFAGPAAAADCDRACLKAIADGYFEALARHDASGLPLAPAATFTENGAAMKLGDGFWKTAGRAGYRMDLFDPDNGDVGVQAVVQEKDAQALYVVRLKVKDRRITEIETVVVRKGDYGALWGVERMKEVSPNFKLSIRKAEQNSRYELMAAGDAYFRAFETNGSPDYRPAPLLPSTVRHENGVQTTLASFAGAPPSTAAEQFDSGRFKGATIYDRRYPVVDTERGVVMSIVRFGPRPATPTRAADAPLVAEIFAVQAGKIVEVEVALIVRPVGSPTGW